MNVTSALRIGIVALIMGLSSNLVAASNKMAIVDMRNIIANSPQVEMIEQKIRKEFKDKSDKLVALGESAQKLQEKLKREQATLTLTQNKEMTRELEDKQREYQVERQRLQQDITQRRKQEEMAYQAKIQKAIQEVAKAEKVDMVLEKAVFYVSPANVVDITEKVKAKIK